MGVANTYTDGTVLAPQAPRHQACGVIHLREGWFTYWDGGIGERCFDTRTQAIDELAKMDRAERFCESLS